MMSNKDLTKSIWDCSWSELVRQIKYKSEWYGRKVVQIERFFYIQFVTKKIQILSQEIETFLIHKWKVINIPMI